MLTIREVIKTFYNALLQRLKKHRGNWDQNDPTADDYIKNRPFYTDETKKTVNVPEQKITIPSENPFAQLVLPELIEFVVGQAYEVKWDDKTYSCVAFDMDGIGAIGNQGIFIDGTDTGEPFIIMISKAEGMGMVVAPEAIGTHTVEASCVKVVKLDKKYLPDLGLAPVATSGSYYDLEDTPTTYSDVVRYNNLQNLSISQKQTARTNIGAAATSDLATVATSGDYNDLENKPCSEIISYSAEKSFAYGGGHGDSSNISYNNSGYTSSELENNEFSWSIRDSTGTKILLTDYTKGRLINDGGSGVKYGWGNLYLLHSNLYEDTGENWYVTSWVYGPSKTTTWYYLNSQTYRMTLYGKYRATTITELDEKFIPDTIARVSELPQSDWSVHDASNLAHVKNRIAYEDVIDTLAYAQKFSSIVTSPSPIHEGLPATSLTDDGYYFS